MPGSHNPATAAQKANMIEPERQNFRTLLLANPNYFGNLMKSSLKPVSKISNNTFYEELTCVSFNPDKNTLEATIAIKQPYGYGGDLCSPGTFEYVRFFLDYGSGWEDVGYTGVNVHDIPTEKDCAGQPDKPLTYVATLKIQPKTDCCFHPVLPKVHAILSWEWIPPAGPANVSWLPPWGNALDCTIQISPQPWNISCLIEEVGQIIGQAIKVPPLFEAVQHVPIPTPDPPPYTLAQLAKMYSKAENPQEEKLVGSHRFGIADLHSALALGGFTQEAQMAKVAEWKSLGLNWAEAISTLANTEADVSYEELECLGMDEVVPERLVATFRVKQSVGYSGDLCHPGSFEYVAFWADWNDTCDWTYLGTAKVNVHDIPGVPAKKGLCYSAIMPVDLTYVRRNCDQPKIARIRAVLSWAVPPSATDPDALNYWGNLIDTHVQINPGDVIEPGHPVAKIRNLGGVAIEEIDTAVGGMTISTAKFAHYPWIMADEWNMGRACPFGSTVVVEGDYYLGYYYRVKVRKVSSPLTVVPLMSDFWVERATVGFDHQVPLAGGWFQYLDPLQEFDRILGVWSTTGDDLWEVQLDIATAPNDLSIVSSSPWYRLQLDNTAPSQTSTPVTMDLHIAAGGDCKDFNQGTPLSGTFIADDLHFGAWALSTEPNSVSTPSNQPAPLPLLSSTSPAPAPSGNGWTLSTTSPIQMKPCGYVIRLDVWDRSILNSYPGSHDWNHVEVGFCLRAVG